MAEESILTRSEPLTISAEEADRLLGLGSGDAALLYLWLLRNGGRFDSLRASRELKTVGTLSAAMAQLQSAGLVRLEGETGRSQPPVREELSEFTAAELISQAENDEGFQLLIREATDRLGRVLSGGDVKILCGIYRDLGLPTEVILLLLGHCCEEFARRYGPGRRPTMRQVEREAYIWHNRELFSLELADRYLQERKKKRGLLGEYCELLGIRGRALAPTEEKYLMSWLDMGFGKEAVLLAFDKTVSKKGELAWPYMNRILENWHAKGLHTLPEIEAGDAPPGRKGREDRSGKEPAGPTLEEYERMQKNLRKLNGGGNHGT